MAKKGEKYIMGQEIEFTLGVPKSIGDVVKAQVADDAYYFEIVEHVSYNVYKGKMIGLNAYLKAVM